MEFSFEVDPDLDLAVGSELSFEDGDHEYEGEELVLTGIDPLAPTEAKPGSEDKVKMLAARYAAGIPLWHNADCYDHGPPQAEFPGSDDFAVTEEEEELDL
ncbi:MAG: hypothetical protein JNG89_11340 [Planctomycetaceae bacterium]|nr:hypothetical protein [Planctomycetaceae bacterium]